MKKKGKQQKQKVNKALRKERKDLYCDENITGNKSNIYGCGCGLSGDASNLRGDVTLISGVISPDLSGDVSLLRGSITGVVGNIDDCRLTRIMRVEDLIYCTVPSK